MASSLTHLLPYHLGNDSSVSVLFSILHEKETVQVLVFSRAI